MSKDKFIIRPIKRNKANGQLFVSVGKVGCENDMVIIKKLNVRVPDTSAKIESSTPTNHNEQV